MDGIYYQEPKNREIWIDWMRLAACFMVVVTHCRFLWRGLSLLMCLFGFSVLFASSVIID